ncbi:MAG TPA: hypothetical protein VKT26_03475 [Acetobacteraceae bacterium]|nr:hypothetical protein [Acetobacteraceae bacterium]
MTETLALSNKQVLRELDLGKFPLHIFDSHCMLAGQRHTFDRECSDGSGIDTLIRLDSQPLDFGEDPRAFVHNNEVCAVSSTHVAGYGYRNHLYICHHNGTFDRLLLVVPTELPPGKNWSPFTFPDGGLGFVHTMDPLVLLREKRRERGVIVMEPLHGLSVQSEAGPGQFSAYRGGTCGVTLDNQIFGFGHTTRYLPGEITTFSNVLGFDHLYHRPFGWLLDPAGPVIRFFDVTGPFDAIFSVIDPTSLLALADDRMELITTEVERHFHDTSGRGEVCSYDFQVPSWLRSLAKHRGQQTAIPARRFLSTVGRLEGNVLQAKLGSSQGHVIYGPYVELPAGNYHVRFLFHLDNAHGTDDARLRFGVAADAKGCPETTEISLRVLPTGPHGIEHAADLQFSHTTPAAKLEFRIHARGFSAGNIAFRGVLLRQDG